MKTWKKFAHIGAKTVDEAASILRKGNATVKRSIDAEQFWDMAVPGSTVLAADEIVTEIQVPAPPNGAKSAFIKFAIRKYIRQ